jgi:hypothetical protein
VSRPPITGGWGGSGCGNNGFAELAAAAEADVVAATAAVAVVAVVVVVEAAGEAVAADVAIASPEYRSMAASSSSAPINVFGGLVLARSFMLPS